MYLGPDALMPAASAGAAAIGLVLMFGRRLVGAIRRAVQWMTAHRRVDRATDE